MHELEWRRASQLVRQTVGGDATSLDHTNENLMAWNKGSVSSPILATVCQRSVCVMATKASAHECFEMNNWKSVAPSRKRRYFIDEIVGSRRPLPKRIEREESF